MSGNAQEKEVQEPVSFYDAVGGEKAFRQLVHRFYQGVAKDPLLRPMYPEEDLSGAEDRLRMFLEQYWGGPTTYSQTRGHPRLRMRHSPFKIGSAERDAWLRHMRERGRLAGAAGGAGQAALGLPRLRGPQPGQHP